MVGCSLTWTKFCKNHSVIVSYPQSMQKISHFHFILFWSILAIASSKHTIRFLNCSAQKSYLSETKLGTGSVLAGFRVCMVRIDDTMFSWFDKQKLPDEFKMCGRRNLQWFSSSLVRLNLWPIGLPSKWQDAWFPSVRQNQLSLLCPRNMDFRSRIPGKTSLMSQGHQNSGDNVYIVINDWKWIRFQGFMK